MAMGSSPSPGRLMSTRARRGVGVHTLGDRDQEEQASAGAMLLAHVLDHGVVDPGVCAERARVSNA
jgi:hypothetical protein